MQSSREGHFQILKFGSGLRFPVVDFILDFSSAPDDSQELDAKSNFQHQQPARIMLLDMSLCSELDYSTACALVKLSQSLARQDRQLVLVIEVSSAMASVAVCRDLTISMN